MTNSGITRDTESVPRSYPDAVESTSRGENAILPEGDVREVPEPLVEAVRRVFGEQRHLAVQYAQKLATDGVVRGLIGPREAPRLWDRHLLNCAVLGELIPFGTRVTDVGSGAGLPGIVLAVARPDLEIVLLEPLARRAAFLTETVAELGLKRVTVVRARAEERAADLPKAGVVTARAVAPLDRLAGWCLPLTPIGGRLLALKGSTAAEEIATHCEAVVHAGGAVPTIKTCGGGLLDSPVTVVEVVREREVKAARTRRKAGRGKP